jgi:hypothetical protein
MSTYPQFIKFSLTMGRDTMQIIIEESYRQYPQIITEIRADGAHKDANESNRQAFINGAKILIDRIQAGTITLGH